MQLITHYDNSIPEVLAGDPVRLHQIILNLVSNAIKFTSIGKIIVEQKYKYILSRWIQPLEQIPF